MFFHQTTRTTDDDFVPTILPASVLSSMAAMAAERRSLEEAWVEYFGDGDLNWAGYGDQTLTEYLGIELDDPGNEDPRWNFDAIKASNRFTCVDDMIGPDDSWWDDGSDPELLEATPAPGAERIKAEEDEMLAELIARGEEDKMFLELLATRLGHDLTIGDLAGTDARELVTVGDLAGHDETGYPFTLHA